MTNTDTMTRTTNQTEIQEFDRTGFEGCKFDFVCDGNYLTVNETPEQAIEWFKDFTGSEPKTVKQVSRYPSRTL